MLRKSLWPRGSKEQRRKEKGSDFTAGIFVCLHIQSFSALFCRVGLTNMFTSSPSSSHAPEICPTHTPSTLSDFEGFLWVSTYPRWSVLYPSTGHFLLVDDVHQFDGVVALHVNHRPLQGILSNLVELKRRRRKKTRETQASCFLTKLDRFCNFDMKAVVFKRDLLCTAKVLNNAVCLCRTPHLQVFLWPCMSTDAPATFFLQHAANQNKAG